METGTGTELQEKCVVIKKQTSYINPFMVYSLL
jgi:hypothetical protein